MDEETRMQLERLEGRCIGLTTALASLIAGVTVSPKEAREFVTVISSALE